MKPNDPRTKLQDLSIELTEHVKLLRDYGTTPGNVWLARTELGRINQLAIDIENLLQDIKTLDEDSA